jgi:undecaprenyl pyrophosphate phosphatase UppP
MTGVRAYMSGKLKVRGDLMLAQRLEEVFNKTGGQEVNIYVMILGIMSAAVLNAFAVQRALDFLKKNEKEIASITRAKL